MPVTVKVPPKVTVPVMFTGASSAAAPAGGAGEPVSATNSTAPELWPSSEERIPAKVVWLLLGPLPPPPSPPHAAARSREASANNRPGRDRDVAMNDSS